jgi:drug/metabolite transporter (DMT)-like permease
MVDSRTLAALFVTITFWASAFPGIRAGLASYSPGPLALLRFLVASCVLAAYACTGKVRPPARKDVLFMVLAGFIGIAFCHVSLNYGEITVAAGTASFLIGTVPIFSTLLAALVLRERLGIRKAAGIIVSFAGVMLITVGQGRGLKFSFDFGTTLILMSAIALSIFFVLQKPYLPKYSAVEFMCYTMWSGTIFLLVFLPELITQWRGAPLNSTMAGIYLGVFPTVVSYAAWTYALSRAPVSHVTSFMYITPALACLIAWVWLGEIPTILSFVGGGVALGGVVMVNVSRV